MPDADLCDANIRQHVNERELAVLRAAEAEERAGLVRLAEAMTDGGP